MRARLSRLSDWKVRSRKKRKANLPQERLRWESLQSDARKIVAKNQHGKNPTTVFRVYVTNTAKEMLDEIRHENAATHRKILEKIGGLRQSPEKQGRALLGPLKGLRRIVVAGRYRVIYRVMTAQVTVHVVAAGARKAGDHRDIYEIAQKLLRAKLL